VGYDSAGTVEFLVDSKRNFYFLEMNTRLQVEHPITECITGIDIVQQMLRVAYGHPLRIHQNQVPLRGWAFESRVYAEDPYKGFGLPSVGRLSRYIEPRHLEGVRCDSGIREGSEISIYYDPLICKLVTHGKDRNQALDRMKDALDQYVIRGVTNNIPLLRDIVEEKRFRSGNITTKYLPETYPDGFSGATLSPAGEQTIVAIASALHARVVARAKQFTNQTYQQSTRYNPFSRAYKFVVEIPQAEQQQRDKRLHDVEVEFHNADPKRAKVTVNGNEVEVEGDMNLAKPVISLKADKKEVAMQIFAKKAGEITLIYKGTLFKVKVMPSKVKEVIHHMKEKPKADLSSVVLSPMPGAIKTVSVQEGSMVSEGQELVIMEAMKMQNALHAGKTGKVKKVNVKPGDTVDEGEVLVELE